MSDATELIDAQIGAYRERDLEKFLGFYSDDIQIKDADGTALMNRTAMADRYGRLFRDSPDLAVDVVNRMVVGSFVVDEEMITGFVLEGYPTELHAVAIYRIEGGKIQGVILLS